MKQITGTSCSITRDGIIIGKNGFALKPKLTKTGYHEISLYFKELKCKKFFRVHRLVAINFIDNPENKPFVNHKDGNKTNNCVENLEWVTHQENMEHAKNFGLVKRAEENPRSILTTPQVETICKMLQQGYRNVDIARTIGITSNVVSYIRNSDSWTHISCKYNIPKRSRSLSDDTAHWICRQLELGLTQGEILSKSNNHLVTLDIIKDMRRKRIYKDIVEEYNF